jgi:hypothetical protein
MVEFKCNQEEEGWAKSFKEYTAKREEKKWRNYFILKKECNKIKFQRRKEKIMKYKETMIQEKQIIMNSNDEEVPKNMMFKGYIHIKKRRRKRDQI